MELGIVPSSGSGNAASPTASSAEPKETIWRECHELVSSKPAMPSAMTRSAAVQNAFALARSGQCRSVAAIIRRLSEQDRPAVEEHLKTPAARRELILICSDAWLAAG
jgi:hypothetical protein